MFRYVAAVWDARSSEHCKLARALGQKLRGFDSRWEAALSTDGSFVYCIRDPFSSDDFLRLDGRNGVILGTLFHQMAGSKARAPRVTVLSETDVDQIVATRGRCLVSSYWGSYVLLLEGEADKDTIMFRGPLSRLPCFHTNVSGMKVFFAEVSDAVALQVVRPSINYDLIRAQAAGGDYMTAETGLSECSALLPGYALGIRGASVTRSTYWSPKLLAGKDEVKSHSEAVSLLESTTRACVSAWSSLHKCVVVTLSGGFDSSVVAACVTESESNPQVIGLNCFDQASADEREFARSMSEKINIELVEREWDPEVDFHRFLNGALSTTPSFSFTAFDAEPACVNLARDKGATAVFGGELGDDIFGRTAGPETLADCMHRYGLGPTYFRCVVNYAQFKRISVWRARSLSRMYRATQLISPFWSMYRYTRVSERDTRHTHPLLSDEALTEYERDIGRFVHPWFHDVNGVPPGWFQVLFSLIAATSPWFQPTFARGCDGLFVHPLCSQPLFEAYARIPAQFHIHDGHAGAIARPAFSKMISEKVLNRGRSKGTPDVWLLGLFERNRSFLREFLLDGNMVKEKILDRQKVEAAFSGTLQNSKVLIGNILAQVYIEAWLVRWNGARIRNAA